METEKIKTEKIETDDEIDELLDWMVDTFNSGGTNLADYTCTIQDGKIESVSDGQETITLA